MSRDVVRVSGPTASEAAHLNGPSIAILLSGDYNPHRLTFLPFSGTVCLQLGVVRPVVASGDLDPGLIGDWWGRFFRSSSTVVQQQHAMASTGRSRARVPGKRGRASLAVIGLAATPRARVS